MATRMIHPEHGATHAYSEGEIASLRKSGWKPEGESEVTAEVIAEEMVEVFKAIDEGSVTITDMGELIPSVPFSDADEPAPTPEPTAVPIAAPAKGKPGRPPKAK